jgi:transcriptional regulator with XRE-family HTH domain
MTTQRVERGWVPEESFGARLALIRQHYGWNVKEAAMKCHVPVETWRGWERDPRKKVTVRDEENTSSLSLGEAA